MLMLRFGWTQQQIEQTDADVLDELTIAIRHYDMNQKAKPHG